MDGKDLAMINGRKGERPIELKPKEPKIKNEVTHTEFMGFLDPFCTLVTEEKYEQLLTIPKPLPRRVKPELYQDLNQELRCRLLSCFLFTEDLEIEQDLQFDAELQPLQPIPHGTFHSNFPQKHNILDEFVKDESTGAEAEYGSLATRNAEMRKRVAAAVRSRSRVQGYFQALETMHKELENVYRRMRMRRKRRTDELELAVIEEYLGRIDEFHSVFGKPEQFTSDSLVYSDILGDWREGALPFGFEYLP